MSSPEPNARIDYFRSEMLGLLEKQEKRFAEERKQDAGKIAALTDRVEKCESAIQFMKIELRRI